MKPLRKHAGPADNGATPVADADEILQIKLWLLGISPMVWRRVLVPVSYTLRELHGVFQVAMGWEGFHLFQFSLRATYYGSAAMSSADVTLAALRLRKGARFLYEYDLNIPWRHGVRIEDRPVPQKKTNYPQCVAGAGYCPPEDCDDPAGFTGRGDDLLTRDVLEDLDTMVDILGPIVRELEFERPPPVLDDETRWRLEQAIDRTQAREDARGIPFSRHSVNERLRDGEHRELMNQHY